MPFPPTCEESLTSRTFCVYVNPPGPFNVKTRLPARLYPPVTVAESLSVTAVVPRVTAELAVVTMCGGDCWTVSFSFCPLSCALELFASPPYTATHRYVPTTDGRYPPGLVP